MSTFDAPICNGLFCAIHPEYISKGLGKKQFNESFRLLSQFWLKNIQSHAHESHTPASKDCHTPAVEPSNNEKKCLIKSESFFPVRHQLSSEKIQPKEKALHIFSAKTSQSTKQEPQDLNTDMFSPFTPTRIKSPILIGICQTPSSEHFYIANGFKKIFEGNYKDEEYSLPVSVVAASFLEKGVGKHML